MYKLTRKYVRDLLKSYSRTMVGKLCKQIESLQKDLDKNSNEFKYLSHAKNLHKETIYETFRDLQNQINAYNSGLNYKKFTIKPSNQQKVD